MLNQPFLLKKCHTKHRTEPMFRGQYPGWCSCALLCLSLLLSLSTIACRKSLEQNGTSSLQVSSANASSNKGKNSSKKQRLITKQEKEPSLETTSTLQTDQDNKRVFVGSVLSNRKVVISPQVGGLIQKIYVSQGDFVKKHARLVWISCRDYTLMVMQVKSQIAVAQAGLFLAQTQKRNAQREYKRFRRLYRSRSLSAYKLDKIKMGLSMANAQESLARKQLQVAKVGLQIANKRRSNCMTKAPFAGIVTQRMMDEGGTVRAMPPSRVLVIEEITPIVIEVPIGEMYIKDLKQVTSFQVIAHALGSKPVYTLSGKKLRESLMPSINPHNRAATLRLKLPNVARKLKPGMSIELHVLQEKSSMISEK